MQKNYHLRISTFCKAKNLTQNISLLKIKDTFFTSVFVENITFTIFMWLFNRVKTSNVHLKIQDVKNLVKKKVLNFIKSLNYKPTKIGMLRGNQENFATSRRCDLAGKSLFRIFFAAFFVLA